MLFSGTPGSASLNLPIHPSSNRIQPLSSPARLQQAARDGGHGHTANSQLAFQLYMPVCEQLYRPSRGTLSILRRSTTELGSPACSPDPRLGVFVSHTTTQTLRRRFPCVMPSPFLRPVPRGELGRTSAASPRQQPRLGLCLGKRDSDKRKVRRCVCLRRISLFPACTDASRGPLVGRRLAPKNRSVKKGRGLGCCRRAAP